MTNLQLLRADETSLEAPELRRLAVLRSAITPMPCASCRQALDLLEASGLDDVDAFTPDGSAYRCKWCGTALQAVPAPGNAWRWRRKACTADGDRVCS